MQDAETKRCSRCADPLPLVEFGRHKGRRSGTESECYSCKRKRTIRRKFGLSPEQYDALLIKQNGVCGICRRPEQVQTKRGKKQMLAVDHCHTTGKVRGLLCGQCNRALGMLSDSPLFVARAAAYLLEHPDEES